MIRFDSDYLEGAHPKVLKSLVDTNFEQTMGYGKDDYTASAIRKIKKKLKRDDIDVHFLTGGTQTNLVAINSILKSYEAVICAETGHINVHEAGAVEAGGHKIITIENSEGKICASSIKKLMNEYNTQDTPEHMVKPKLVFITLPTECGTNYTKAELEDIYNTCKENNLYLYIDGARLGYGLVDKYTDLKFQDIPALSDIFYIGGTKIGALFGEALVIVNDNLKNGFRYYMKQVGGLLAKGRVLALQFDALMEKDLYLQISKIAVDYAIEIKNAFVRRGYRLLYNSFTNQQFVIMPIKKYNELSKEFSFFKWCDIDKDNIAVRICTSWATEKKNVDMLISKI